MGVFLGKACNFEEHSGETDILLPLNIIMPSFKTKNCRKHFIIMKETGLSEEQT